MASFESVGFVLDDGMRDNGQDFVSTGIDLPIDVSNIEVPFPLELVCKFSLDLYRMPTNNFLDCNKLILDGKKCPTMRDNRTFCFVSQPSTKHLKRIMDSRSLNCNMLKYIKVLSPRYRVVSAFCAIGSFDKKKLYEVLILDYPTCSCTSFKFMMVRTNRKLKWMPCKHLYFLLQHFFCTKDDIFIHCST